MPEKEIQEDKYLNRREQAARTREAVFTAAVELFKKKGFDNVTIREICRCSKIANGTFYLHFKSKYEILYEVYEVVDEIFEKANIYERADLSTREKLLELFRIQLDHSHSLDMAPSTIRQLFAYQIQNDNTYFFSESRAFYHQLFMILEEGKSQGVIRKDQNSQTQCWRILRFSRGIIFDWCLHNCDYDIIEFGLNELSYYLDCFFYKTEKV